MQKKYSQRPDWRTYQARLNKSRARKKLFGKAIKWIIITLVLGITIYGIKGTPLGSAVYSPPSVHIKNPVEKPCDKKSSPASSPFLSAISPVKIPSLQKIPVFNKADLRALLKDCDPELVVSEKFEMESGDLGLCVKTTIDHDLQNFIRNKLDTGTARYIGIVVMDPESGAILSMTGYDSKNSGANPCIQNTFPAASIFKLVTATAAVEKYGFMPSSELEYHGAKHTLYKSQLEIHSKYRENHITLMDSFAQSVNPVFGKLGIHYLGKKSLDMYAKLFGFNTPIDFDMPVKPSTIILEDEPYQWAEVASGFNRSTKISPLHGAIMVSAVISGSGHMAKPWLVKQIEDNKGRILYKHHGEKFNTFFSEKCTNAIKKLMAETIHTGTCRKDFRGYETNKVLSRLEIGGKTGSINSRAHENRRFDWFIGFAKEKKGREKIVISAVVVHEKYIGTKARTYGRMIIEHYFKRYFNNKEKKYAGL